MIPSSVICRMASLGLDERQASIVADMLAEVERATEERAAEAINARRTADRNRQSRHRGNVMSRDITLQNVTTCYSEPGNPRACGITAPADAVITVGSSNQVSNTPSETTSPHPLPARKSDRGTRLPDDWKPDDDLLKFCASNGLSPELTGQTVSEFVNYWTALPGARARKLDWPKTFKNRVLEVAGRNSRFQARAGPSGGYGRKAPGGLAQAMMNLQKEIEDEQKQTHDDPPDVLRLSKSCDEADRGYGNVGGLISGAVKRF